MSCSQTQKAYRKKYYLKNKNKDKEYRKTHPWISTYVSIRQRCNNKKCQNYKYYGGKGIKCLITSDELKQLWFRDKAYLMKLPTIDRENNKGNYVFSNCSYIEKSENSAKDKRKAVLQFDLQGNFIKEWRSQTSAGKDLGIHLCNINSCLRKKTQTSGGFVWKYKVN